VPNTHVPKAGEVWYVNFDPQVGREQGGIRPALVISNDTFNLVRNGLHIVVPLTSRDRELAYHVKIEPPEGGLTRTSLAMCEQERSQSVDRFRRLQGTVTSETLRSVQRIVAEFIDAYKLYR
jgi:mRNA interferase MazF